ncbi:hypothetical protein FEM48_Zijuj12G0186600 [Ziziphus jujuba var. spinosa]|uniref:non-specific serine/threonine protein kinase n=1 Tax=Ziziphus jujuba var. spinosa TaxID=714518 RepID=A0A978UEW8_ZIZJJ|nr:hypothetical protein FEM48_Zijuj12G0186600 [Ziziphus jujuba var. spinosa]
MSKPSATIVVGGAAGAIAFIAVVIGIVWFCKFHSKKFSNKNSETGSSDPSALVEWNRGGTSSGTAPHPMAVRQFTLEELGQATKHFNESNLIGYGSFGTVYQGLLRDGTVVAIKRRAGPPQQEFVSENEYAKCPSTKLEFKKRLTIALGAARGLCHLHGLKPPIVHKNFKTANVLVDENFIARIADAGVSRLLEKIEEAGPSDRSSVNVFQDPEVGSSGTASDVYSFGVFLLELITGREALHNDNLGSNESLIQWVETQLSMNDFVDHRLDGSFTAEGMRDLIRLTLQCMSFPGRRRPKMEMVVRELERIQEREMALTTIMGESTATITPGSLLFS